MKLKNKETISNQDAFKLEGIIFSGMVSKGLFGEGGIEGKKSDIISVLIDNIGDIAALAYTKENGDAITVDDLGAGTHLKVIQDFPEIMELIGMAQKTEDGKPGKPGVMKINPR